jgi:hypothetical protein
MSLLVAKPVLARERGSEVVTNSATAQAGRFDNVIIGNIDAGLRGL